MNLTQLNYCVFSVLLICGLDRTDYSPTYRSDWCYRWVGANQSIVWLFWRNLYT